MNIDKLFLGFIFLIPLLPRPTALGPEKYVVPFLLGLLIVAWLYSLAGENRVRGGNLQLLSLILGFPIATYLLRVFVQGGVTAEAMHIVARMFFVIGLFAMVHWLSSTSVSLKIIFRTFLIGFLATTLLTIFCGITGTQILEEESIKPSRFFGFHKSTGIFRSFGEFGIMGSVALSYLVVFRRDFKNLTWFLATSMVVLALLISQSRNVYLTGLIVLTTLVAIRTIRLPRFALTSFICLLICVPAGVEIFLPVLKQSAVGQKLLGTGTMLERNVEVRLNQFGVARELLSKDPIAALVGHSRSAWRDFMIKTRGGTGVLPHNHFLSSIVFLGLAGGIVWILGLFLLPGVMLAQRPLEIEPCSQIAFASLSGTLVGLSFYEGFFSVVVMLVIAICWNLSFSHTLSDHRG